MRKFYVLLLSLFVLETLSAQEPAATPDPIAAME